ncbi:non-specific serine/threonine protein kinase [Ranunculus cassubicifolius]
MEVQIETLEHQFPAQLNSEIEEWESKVRIWLSSLPDQSELNMIQFESWINSDSLLPQQFQSLSISQLFDKVVSLKTTPQYVQGKASRSHPARFQRTDQWIPVYAWLESLDKNEVVKSKDITDWLSENPDVKEKLYSRHSRYHLMHYVQKCHMKILKRQGKLPKVIKPISARSPTKFVNKEVPTVAAVAVTPYLGTHSGNMVKNKDVSLIKRNDDFSRYQLFTELENQLRSLLSKQNK